ncbi:MAG: hypothetical protein VYC39_05485 [Myxococcota bacterium]|nr:hypothetical protein [Myxococcota bacterium]
MNGQKTRTILVIGLLCAIPIANAYADKRSQKRLVNQLLDVDKAPKVALEIIENGTKMLPHLEALVVSDAPLVSRGWAVVATGRIAGPKSKKYLESWSTDSSLPELIRTWSRAARIEIATTLSELQELVRYTRQTPSLNQPWGKRAQELLESSGQLESENVESILKLAVSNPQISSAIAPAILRQPMKELARVMFSSENNRVRRMAASYLGSIAKEKGISEIAPQLAEMYRYTTKRGREGVFWKGGGLFVPGIRWPRESARKLMFNLIQWLQYTEGQGLKGQSRQLMNNLRSVSLHRRAGVRVRGYRPSDYFLLLEEL